MTSLKCPSKLCIGDPVGQVDLYFAKILTSTVSVQLNLPFSNFWKRNKVLWNFVHFCSLAFPFQPEELGLVLKHYSSAFFLPETSSGWASVSFSYLALAGCWPSRGSLTGAGMPSYLVKTCLWMSLQGSFWKRLTFESVDYAKQIALVQLWRVLSKAKSLNKREFISIWRFSSAVKLRLDLRPLAVLVLRPLDCRSWDFLVSVIVWATYL